MVKIIICAFDIDNKRTELLKVCLYSIYKNTPYDIVVYHNNIPPETQKEIKDRIHKVELIPFRIVIEREIEIASQKMYMWNKIMEDQEDEGLIILSDLDTLYLKDVSDAFDTGLDIGYTAKDDTSLRYPLNTGILFFRVNDRSKRFLKGWMEETNRILYDKDRSKEAIDTFGGVDQKSLSIMIGKSTNFFGLTESNGVKLFGFKASQYNVHKDWSNPYVGGMLHFKGCWKDVLVNDKNKLKDILQSNPYLAVYPFLAWERSFVLWREYQAEYYSNLIKK